jgi:Holliday junction DNA helicase RuvA
LQTYDALAGQETVRLWAVLQVREDAHSLFGFAKEAERELFLALLSVSGIGGNTALALLSGLSTEKIITALAGEQVQEFERIKGIGKKTAARLVLELKDKVAKLASDLPIPATGGRVTGANTQRVRTEALAALQSLGFARTAVEKKVDETLSVQPDIKVEELIKMVLRGG